MFILGAGIFGLHGQAAANRWLSAVRGPFEIPAAIAAFCVLAVLGVPQFMLIAAAGAAFGSWRGAVYSWLGTMASAQIGFEIGRAWGAGLVGRLKGATVRRFLELVARNGFLASVAVRIAPFAPFVAVNIGAGASPIKRRDFALGTALGIIPKIVLTAFAGNALVRGLPRGGWVAAVVLVVLVGGAWIASRVAARRWLRR